MGREDAFNTARSFEGGETDLVQDESGQERTTDCAAVVLPEQKTPHAGLLLVCVGHVISAPNEHGNSNRHLRIPLQALGRYLLPAQDPGLEDAGVLPALLRHGRTQ